MGALFSTVDEVQLAAVKTLGGPSCVSVCSINANAWLRQALSPVKGLRTTPTVPGWRVMSIKSLEAQLGDLGCI
jgi:hypothetical protein